MKIEDASCGLPSSSLAPKKERQGTAQRREECNRGPALARLGTCSWMCREDVL